MARIGAFFTDKYIMAITKDYMKLSPEQHFMTVYKSKIVMDGEKIAMYEPLNITYGANPHHQHIQQRMENVVAIKMPESEYQRFMTGYENYLDLIYGMRDPIVKDMFEKMMVYIKLMK
jgi:hypothetical protein